MKTTRDNYGPIYTFPSVPAFVGPEYAEMRVSEIETGVESDTLGFAIGPKTWSGGPICILNVDEVEELVDVLNNFLDRMGA